MRKTENENESNESAPVRAVETEVSTTKTPDQKAEIADELFPPALSKKSMSKTHRVLH